MPKKTIAIFGGAATGKTTLARSLAGRYGYAVRHCGKEIAAAASRLGVAEEHLPVQVHTRIDLETRTWTSDQSRLCVAEGRFLDLVLADQPAVVFVRCDASLLCRVKRMSERLSRVQSEKDIAAIDESDSKARFERYNTRPALPAVVLNTETESLEHCIAAILRAVEEP